MEKINGRWMHDGKEYEVVDGSCKSCCFWSTMTGCSLKIQPECINNIGLNAGFKLKENQNMIKPFKCAAMTPDRVVAMKWALAEKVENLRVFDEYCDDLAVYVFFDGRCLDYERDGSLEYFVNRKEREEMTFDQAMEMILAAPVLVPAPKFEFKPFDQILRQNKHSETWKIGFYSHIEPNNFIGLNQATVMRMLPYKGNENLLNTKTKPKGWWEVENGRPVWRVE